MTGDAAKRVFVDGQLATSANVAPDAGKTVGSADTALAVNLGQDGTGGYTDGGGAAAINMIMDDVGVWNRALAPSEAASIYVQGQTGKDLTTASGAPVILPATIATSGRRSALFGSGRSPLTTSP
jgi:hypothetical protein